MLHKLVVLNVIAYIMAIPVKKLNEPLNSLTR